MGFSIEETTFKYSGKQYGLSIKLIDLDTMADGNPYQFNLANGCIQILEIAGGFNDLFLEASLEYSDSTGQVLTFVGRQNVACNIDFVEIHQDFDASFGSETIRPERSFKHEFIIKKLEILQREAASIKYKFHLVSMNWLKLVANIAFSNYDRGKQSVFEILKQCLVVNGLDVDTQSFNDIGSSVSLNYATSGRENVFTIFNYLMNKLYYYASNYEETMKFVWIDHITGQYKLFDFSKPPLAVNPKNLIITTNPSNMEKVAEREPNQLGSMSAFPTTQFYESLFQRSISEFSYDSNEFTTNLITDDQILEYSNSTALVQSSNTKQFRKAPSIPDLTDSKYLSRCSTWDNPTDIYSEQATSLLVGRSIIINTSGNIEWKPTTVVNLSFQKDEREMKGDTQKEYDNWDKTFAGLNGTWIVTKVRHIIQPIEKKYRQNLILARNFKMPGDSKK